MNKTKLKIFSKYGLIVENHCYKAKIKSNVKKACWHEIKNSFCTYCPSPLKS